MIQITVNSEMYAYDMYHITKAFCPGVQIEQKVNKEQTNLVEIKKEENVFVISEEEIAGIEDRKLKKRRVNICLYKWLKKVTGKELAWGIMTGVRPTKPIMTLMEQGLSDEDVASWMQENYLVNNQEARFYLSIGETITNKKFNTKIESYINDHFPKEVIRSKGIMWLAEYNDASFIFEQAGKQKNVFII